MVQVRGRAAVTQRFPARAGLRRPAARAGREALTLASGDAAWRHASRPVRLGTVRLGTARLGSAMGGPFRLAREGLRLCLVHGFSSL
ncbi:MAG TPA: hypothetical protein VF933_30480 [Streptosporangiaceae bacterium]